jgi:hypothetical protein
MKNNPNKQTNKNKKQRISYKANANIKAQRKHNKCFSQTSTYAMSANGLVLLVAWALLELSDLRIVLFCDDVGDGI